MALIFPRFKFRVFLFLLTLTIFIPGGFPLSSRDFYPFGTENGDSVMPKTDDGFVTLPLRAGIAFPFFNESYTSLSVNTNGAISFRAGVTNFTPSCGALNEPMITPFWADVDNTKGGDIFYRETRSPNLLQKANQDIRKAFPNLWSVKSTSLFIATWSNVAFYKNSAACTTDPRNSFQVILSTDGTHSFAIFYYGALQWTTGMASNGSCFGLGGTAAKAGFDFGDGQTFFKLPGSCTTGILNVAQSSNMNENGKWIFRIDSALQPGGCNPNYNRNTKLHITPSFVRSLGHVPLRIRGPCLDKSRVRKVTCRFHDLKLGPVDVTAFLVDDDFSLVCQVPFLYSNGRIKVNLIVYEYQSAAYTIHGFQEGGFKETKFTGYVYVMEGHPDFPAKFVGKDKKGKLKVNLQWDPKLLSNHVEGRGRRRGQEQGPNSQPTPLQIHLIESDGTVWKDSGVLKQNVTNTGNLTFVVRRKRLADLISFRLTPKPPQIIDEADIRQSSNPRKKRAIRYPRLSEMLEHSSLFSTVSNIYETSLMTQIRAHERCLSWYETDPGVTQGDLEHCPPLLSQAQMDPRFATRENIWIISQIHDNATASYIQRTPGANGGGRECAYGRDGRIIFGPSQGGASNRFSPLARFGFLPHFYRDILSFHFCCRTGRDDLCRKYYERRPPSKGTEYAPPRSARALGDPHIVTFDLASYSFNGVGEFWMIKAGGAASSSSAQNFSMQARMEPLVSGEENGTNARASVFTAFVMTDGITKIQVQISSTNSSDLDVILDDDRVDFDEDQQEEEEEESDRSTLGQGQNFVVPCETATIEKTNGAVIVSYSIGLSFTITANSNALGITSLASSNIKASLPEIQGLMGNIDGESENDLRALNGTLIPVNSTLRKIHYDFGLTWMTSPNDTLFVYPEGKNYETYSKPEFEPNLKIPDPADLPESVVTLCKGSPECLFDFVASGSVSFAQNTLESIETFNETVETLTQTIDLCSDIPSFENGLVTFSNLFEGSHAFFECEEGADLVGAGSLTCIKDETSIRWNGSWPKCFKDQEFICPRNGSIYPCTCSANSQSGPQIRCSGPEVTQTTIDLLFKALRSANSITDDSTTDEPQRSLKIHKLTIESTNLDQLNLSPLTLTKSKVKVTQLNIHHNTKLVSIVGPLPKENLNLIDAFELSIVKSALTDEGLSSTLSYFSNSMNFLTISESNIRGPIPIHSQENSTEIRKTEPESNSEFLPGLFALKNLTYLNLDHNQIHHVEKHSFTFLPKLRFLTLSNNRLGEGGEIKLDAFVSESHENLSNHSRLFIRLSSNRLTIKNFISTPTNETDIETENGNKTALTLLRPIKLDLTYNQLNGLTSLFFKSFLLANPKNQINLRQNPIMCNNLMQWLKDGTENFQRQVFNIDCKNDPQKTVFTSKFLK